MASPVVRRALARAPSDRYPTALELGMCRFQGEHVARITRDLVAGRGR
jgi:hypothetical protein